MSSGSLKDKVRAYWDNEPCGTNRPTSEKGTLAYFEEIEEYRYRVEPFIHSFVQFTRWHSKKTLEVGCGAGTDTLQFARAGANHYAIDISPNSVELTKKRLEFYGLKAEVEVADAEKLPFVNAQFDLVLAWGILHHTPDTQQAISEIYRVLKPNGTIKIMLYHRYSWLAFKVYLQYGILGLKPFTSLTRLIANHVESQGTKAYTIKEVRGLFSAFYNLEVHPILTPYDTIKSKGIFPPSLLAHLFGDRLGWFILITGRK